VQVHAQRLTPSAWQCNGEVTKLHHHKSTLKVERATTVDLTNSRARARDVATTINREGAQRPTFTKAS
jgi:hypothetical protein